MSKDQQKKKKIKEKIGTNVKRPTNEKKNNR